MKINQNHSGIGNNSINNPVEMNKKDDGLFTVKNIISWIIAPLIVAVILYWVIGIK